MKVLVVHVVFFNYTYTISKEKQAARHFAFAFMTPSPSHDSGWSGHQAFRIMKRTKCEGYQPVKINTLKSHLRGKMISLFDHIASNYIEMRFFMHFINYLHKDS